MSTATVLEQAPFRFTASLVSPKPGEIRLHARIENTSKTTVHLFDDEEMPYRLLREEDGALLVLHGVNPPDPMRSYYAIKIPITRPLAPGQALSLDVPIVPITLRDHYQADPEPEQPKTPFVVHFQVGWGAKPILASETHRVAIDYVLEWQTLVTGPTLRWPAP